MTVSCVEAIDDDEQIKTQNMEKISIGNEKNVLQIVDLVTSYL